MRLQAVVTNVIQVPIVAAVLALSAISGANEVNLTADLPFLDVQTETGKVRIERIQDQNNVLTGGFAKTSRKCPPFCIHPMSAATGVKTVGEIELLDFLIQSVGNDTGVLVDARTPSWYQRGTIPGSENIPFTACTADIGDPNFEMAMDAFGITQDSDGTLNYSEAKDLVLFCNGPWCGQSPRAIKGLLKKGYPPSKLYYYRGGMQVWQILGMTTVPGTNSQFN